MKQILKSSEYDPVRRLKHWNPLIRRAYKNRFTTCLSQLHNNGKILELGIGSGYTIPFLVHKGFCVFGVDLHKNLLHIRRFYRNYDFTLIRGDALNLPFRNHTFDSVMAISVLEHIKSPKNAIIEIKRVLKYDGEAIFGIPIENSFTRLWFFLSRSPAFHEHRSHKELIPLVKNNFQLIKERRLFFCIQPLNYYIVLKCQKPIFS